ncbi:MAG: phosphotransferase family protein [Pirellulales bacterium]
MAATRRTEPGSRRASQLIDGTQPVREGEELDLAKLQSYLREHLPEAAGPVQVEQFPRGFSNLTYLVRVGEREFVLRRPPFGNPVKSAHDMGREFRALSKLWRVYPPAPRPFVYCDDPGVLGEPFYLMERRQGIVLRKQVPPGLDLGPETARRLSESFIDNLADLHCVDHEAAGLGDLGRPAGYVERQVTGWAKRYEKARTEDVPDIQRVSDWLHKQMPSESGAALIHNDYKYDNLILDPNDPTRIVAVLDWEMCTVGDPLMDLGTTLAYWVEADDEPARKAIAFGPTDLPGSLTRRELAQRYAARTGADVSNMLYYVCYGLFKIAVVVQQIHVRYARGHTRDERFATLNQSVKLLGRVAVEAIETGKY